MDNDVVFDKLRDLYQKSTVNQNILNSFKGYPKTSKTITTDRILELLKQQKTPVERPQVTKFLQILDESGFGKFKMGRKGHPSRFEANETISSIGHTAYDTSTIEATLQPEKPKTVMLSHTYILRSGMEIRIELPNDLTSSEASRVSEFIKTLPFS